MGVFFFNIWYYTLFCVATVLSVAVSLPLIAGVRLFTGKRAALRATRIAIVLYGKICMALTWPFIRLNFSGYEKGEKGKARVYICNHQSSSDPFLMGLINAELVQVVNIWPFKLPILGPVAKIAGYLSVREMPFEDFKTRASSLLADGVSICAFPEGTRSRDGNVGPFHGAIFRVCQNVKVPIVPVCITGNADKPRRGTIVLQPGRVQVDCLPPIRPETYEKMSAFQIKNHVRNAIIQHLNGLSREKKE